MADSGNDLKGWLDKELKSADKPTMLALFHLNASGTADRAALDQRNLGPKDKADEIATWIVQTCQDDATAFGGVQRYKVVAVRQPPGLTVRKVLRFEPPLDEQPGTETGPTGMVGPLTAGSAGPAGPSEDLARSIISELMEHMRATQQMFLGGFNGLMAQWQTLNGTMSDIVKQQANLLGKERERNQVEHVERKVESVLEMELQMEKEERERKSRRDDKVFEQLSLLGPVIMGKLMGGDMSGAMGQIASGGGGNGSGSVSPAQAAAAAVADAQMRSFFMSLSPEQQEQFITRLDDGQLQGYNAIMERIVKPGNGA